MLKRNLKKVMIGFCNNNHYIGLTYTIFCPCALTEKAGDKLLED